MLGWENGVAKGIVSGGDLDYDGQKRPGRN